MHEKLNVTRIATECPDGVTCNAVDVIEGDPDGVYITGAIVTDPRIRAAIPRANHEDTVRFPRWLWEQQRGDVA